MHRPVQLAVIVQVVVGAVGLVIPARAADAPAGENGLVLVREGKALGTIVTAAKPSENARAAASELQKYIEKITGAKLRLAPTPISKQSRCPPPK